MTKYKTVLSFAVTHRSWYWASIFIAVLLPLSWANITYGQSTAEKSWKKGVELGTQGNFTEARKEFEEALKADPHFAPAELGLTITEDVISQKIDRETAIHLIKFAKYYREKDWDKAIAECDKLIQINPRNAEVYYNRGAAYDKKAQFDKAIADYGKAIEINPRFELAYYNRGIDYGSKGKYDEAISDFTKAIEINPKSDKAYLKRGQAYAQFKERHDLAISDYNKTIEINPNDAWAYNNRAISHYFNREYDKAWDDVNKAQALGVQINPGFLDALRKAAPGAQK